MSTVSDYFGTLTGNLKKGGNITVMLGLLRRNPCCTGKSLRNIIPDSLKWWRISGCPTGSGKAVT